MENATAGIENEFASLELEAAAADAQESTVTIPPPPGEQEQAKASAAEWKEIIHPVIHMGFTVLAPNWGVNVDESEALADAYVPVLEKYFPDAGTQFGPEISAALVTMAIIAPRLNKPRKLEEKTPDPKPVKTEEPPAETESEPKAGGDPQVSEDILEGVDA